MFVCAYVCACVCARGVYFVHGSRDLRWHRGVWDEEGRREEVRRKRSGQAGGGGFELTDTSVKSCCFAGVRSLQLTSDFFPRDTSFAATPPTRPSPSAPYLQATVVWARVRRAASDAALASFS